MVVSARPARALTSGAARRRRDCAGLGVIVVRQGNRAVLLRRVRSRRRPPDGGASAGLGAWQARRPRRRVAAGPICGASCPSSASSCSCWCSGFVVLGSCSGSSEADQYRSYVHGRQLRRAAVEHRRQGARRRALQPGAHARPGDREGRELHPEGARRRDDGRRRSSRPARSSSRSCSATCCRRCSTARSRCRTSRRRSRRALLGRRPTCPRPRSSAKRVANAYSELIASDVVYAASFQRPAQEILKADERHGRGHHAVGLGPLARARQPGRQRQRAVDRVGARRGLVEAVHGRERSAPRSTA